MDRVNTLLAKLRGDTVMWESAGRWWAVYADWHDWWVGFYVSDRAVYVCPVPCLVIRRMRG